MTRPKNGRKGEVSKGIHKTVSRKTKNLVRRAYLDSGERLQNQLKAFRKGKNVVITIENPNKEETNRRFIRVNGKDFFKPEFAPQKKDKTPSYNQGTE
jgi:hypothetical protein